MVQRWFCLCLCLMLVCLTGCINGSEEEVEAFSITEEKREDYEEKIGTLLYDAYWRYDSSSITFLKGNVPTNTEKNKNMFEASSQVGLNMEPYEGKEATVATATLLYYNGETAGLLYCYFVKDKLIGAYYMGDYQNGVYGLNDRNIFLTEGKFTKYETDTPFASFTGKKSTFPLEGFCDIGEDRQGNLLAAAISEEGRLSIYRYNRSFARYRNLYLQNGLVATSAAFLEDGSGMAVLASRTVTEGTGEGETTYTLSEEVFFLNEYFSNTGESIELPNGNYTCVAFDGAQLLLMTQKTLECYEKGENGWTRVSQNYLEHGAGYIHITDLDNDGTLEYLFTDGFDLYLYQKQETGFVKLWSTHLAIKSIEGGIYSGDLNRDGIKEVYVCDTTGTAMRYILTPKGLVTKNKDIVYGQRIYAMDLDKDGFDEYVGTDNMEQLNTMVYFSQ